MHQNTNEKNKLNKQLILETLLESYRQMRTEIVSSQDNYYTSLNLFLSGIFLLIAYIITTQSYVLILLIPFILLILCHVMFNNYNNVTYLGVSSLVLENKINNLLGAKEEYELIIDFEKKWGGIANVESIDIKRSFLYSIIFILLSAAILITIVIIYFSENYNIIHIVLSISLYIGALIFEIIYCYGVIKKRKELFKTYNNKFYRYLYDLE